MPSSAKLLEKLRPCGAKRLNMFSSGSEVGVHWSDVFEGIVWPKILHNFPLIGNIVGRPRYA